MSKPLYYLLKDHYHPGWPKGRPGGDPELRQIHPVSTDPAQPVFTILKGRFMKKILLSLTLAAGLAAGLAVSGVVRADNAKPAAAAAAPAAVVATKPAEAYRLLAQSTTNILDFSPGDDGSTLLAQSTTSILD